MSFTESLQQLVDENRNGLLGKHSSWSRVELKLVASALNGFAFSSSQFNKDQGTPLLRIRDILEDHTQTKYRGDFDPMYLVRAGELLIGMDGDFNSAIWRGTDALLNQRVCKLRISESFYNPKLLAYALPGYLKAINDSTSSITVKHLSSRTVEEIPLPLPPRIEQDRIVAEIEKQLTRLDDAVAALRRAQANLKRYRASVFKAACEGTLLPTEAELARREHRDYEPASELLKKILAERRAQWEADQQQKMIAAGKPSKGDKWKQKYVEPHLPDASDLPQLPKGWTWTTVEQVSWRVQYGSSAKCTGVGGVPVLRMGNLTADGRLLTNELKYLPKEHAEFPELLLQRNDLLFNRTNSAELVGKTSVYDGSPMPCSFASYLIRVSLLDGCNPEYLSAVLNSMLGRTWIKSVVNQQVGQANVNGSKLQAFLFPLPPLKEQHRIVEQLSCIFDSTLRTEESARHELAKAEHLRQSFLAMAFSGKLVPQDPSDEPAAELLDRIRAAKKGVQGVFDFDAMPKKPAVSTTQPQLGAKSAPRCSKKAGAP